MSVTEDFLTASQAGHTISPPRYHVAFEPHGSLVFTIGGVDSRGRGPIAGFRAYDTFDHTGPSSQIVAVWNAGSGSLLGIIVGDLLGAWRTGALGGVALKYLSRPEAKTCAVIGTGNQARTQLQGALAARNLGDVRVYSRNEERRRSFAAEMSAELQLPIRPVTSAFEAIADVDIVLCATNSTEPVLDVQWLSEGAHVSTIGPKVLSAHELPRDIGNWATIVATDSIEQMQSYAEPYFLEGMEAMPEVHSLAALTSGNKVIRREHETNTLYCSVGLAGTEVAIAAHIIARYSETQHL